MEKITKEQKKIIYISAIIIVSFLLFWFLIYKPQSGEFVLIKNQLDQIDSQISDITSITKGEDLAEVVRKMKIKLDNLSAKFPRGEEEVIHSLSEEARRLNIKVRNIVPSESEPLDSKVGGYSIAELSISMSLTCEYDQLGEYLNILRSDFPVVVQVIQLEINGQGENNPNLNINLNILAYLSKGN